MPKADDITTPGASLRHDLLVRGEAFVLVRGTSMLPSLRQGELVRLVPCPSPRPGDVVAFARGSVVLVHRVVNTGDGYVVCRGDNRLASDGRTPLGAVIGQVVTAFTAERHAARRLAQGRRGRAVGALLTVVLRARGAERRLSAEWRLLVQQLEGSPVLASPGPAVVPSVQRILGVPRDDVRRRGVLVLRMLASGVWVAPPLLDSEAEQPAATWLVVPAGLFCALEAPRRAATLEGARAFTPPHGTMVVAAFARARQHRVARAGVYLRAFLAAAGRPAGAPGDVALTVGAATLPVHLFARDEFVRELHRHGLEPVALSASRDRAGLPLWRAEVTYARAGRLLVGRAPL